MQQRAEDNIRVLKEAFIQLNAENFDGCLDLMMPDFIINIAEMPYQKHGHSTWRQHAEYLFVAIPDAKVHIDDIFGVGDKVAVRLRIKGTHLGEFLGASPTGRVIEYTSHEIYRFEDGRLAEEWICSDSLTLIRQLGLLSRTRFLSLWLADYRFWLGMVSGAILTVVLHRFW